MMVLGGGTCQERVDKQNIHQEEGPGIHMPGDGCGSELGTNQRSHALFSAETS